MMQPLRGARDARASRSPRPTAAIGVALTILMLSLAACDAADGAAAEDASAGATAAAAMDHAAMDHAPTDHATMDHSGSSHTAVEATEPTGYSVYNMESEWTDQHGTERKLRSLDGKVQLVAMLYTNCVFACPRIMLDLKRIEGELEPELAERVGFVVVTIDPERDTPEQLARFARGSRLDPERWILLHGDEGDILELAALLGVQYRETTPGEWVHSNVVTVLDAEGEIVHRQLGLGTDPAGTLAVIRDELR